MKAVAAALLLLAAACGDGPTHGTDLVIDKATGHLGQLERVWSVAELPDGRVVFPQAQAVVRADLAAGTADTLGRPGAGPGEYRRPYRVMLMRGALAMIDGQLARLTLWNLDGSIRSTTTLPTYAAFGGVLDTVGHAWFEQLPANISINGFAEPNRSKDSTQIYRMTLPGPAYDTVGKLFEIGKVTIQFGDGATFQRRLYQSPDVWGVLDDGSLWIARGRENRVDRRGPDGAWTIGTPRAYDPIRTTSADRRHMQSMPGLPASRVLDTMYQPMADTKGPFAEAVAAPDGEVWTRMHQVAGYARERYAIFPVVGASTRSVSLPLGRILVAITNGNIYTVHEDDDGFWELERFPRPV